MNFFENDFGILGKAGRCVKEESHSQ